jgi:ankyrin repeat protein
MVIADKAGMGKTTVLTHLSKRIKQEYPTHWFVRIDLNDYAAIFWALNGQNIDKERVHGFISEEVLKLKTQLEKELFKTFFERNECKKIIVMLDGFDVISPNYKKTVFDMLQVLTETPLEQLWVTTRPHLREELEDKLQQLSYTLQPFSKVEQVDFLKKFWYEHLNLEDKNEDRLQIYAEALISKLAQSIRDKEKQFTGIPLQTRMLAEAFEKKFETFYKSKDSEPMLLQELGLLELYGRFIESKYEITDTQAKTMSATDGRDWYLDSVRRHHKLLALKALFPDHRKTYQLPDDNSSKLDEKLARFGIVQINSEGKLQFIHRTFAEYLVAEFLTHKLRNKTEHDVHVQELLLNEVLLRIDCHVIRVFLDGLLEKSEPSIEALKEYGKKLDEMWKKREEQVQLEGFTTALHEATKEGHVHIIGFLLKSLMSGKHLRTLQSMLLNKDRWGQTAWHKAAENDKVHVLETIWKWVEAGTKLQEGAEKGHLEAEDTNRASVEEENLRPKHIKKNLFVAKDQYGNTAWHGVAQRGNVIALETLWRWGKELGLNPHELLLEKNEEGNTAWQLAVQRGHFEVLKKLWDWAKEAQINLNELKNEFLLAEDKEGYTVWNRAAESGSLETLETLWDLGKEAELKSGEMFLAQGTDGNTAWQVASQRGHFKVLERLWEWAKEEQMGGNYLKFMLLLAKDKGGYTAFHRAAERGNLKALETFWNSIKQAKLNPYESLLVQRINCLAVGS